jgi:DNA-binding XRE family transcriptional regulator
MSTTRRGRTWLSDNFDLTDRDMSEKIWLWRHRQPSTWGISRGRRGGAMSQAEAAETLGLTTQQYIKLENGETTLLSAGDLAKLRWWVSDTDNDHRTITDSELCFLARRRSGMPLREIAKEMRTSLQTLTKMEAEGDDALVLFWRRQGYKFAKGQHSLRPSEEQRPTLRRPGSVAIQRPA